MHVHFEQNTSTRSECTIHTLSWMGKVPESLPEEDGGWKLNRSQYYSEGWLASGNAKGIVGITFTTSHCRKYDAPQRSNFNLRGHRSEVILVRWNEPYQKLATCDSQGVIFVWIKHEGRWSIELINDRNSQVTDFAWSHDGRMALICYCDGFVLVGSVAGQRYWSSMLNLDNTTITCGVWSPDDQKVIFGTTGGQLIVMSSTGAMLTQVVINDSMEISTMAWSCEKFNMDESDAKSTTTDNISHPSEASSTIDSNHVLAICFKYGAIYLMSNYDDICPRVVHTLLTGLRMDWSNCGEILAVGGFIRLPNLQCRNELHFYSRDGRLLHWISIPSQGKPLTALCWGHNDKRLFLASGFNLHVAWITKQVAPLQFLCQRVIQDNIAQERKVSKLPLPSRLRHNIQSLFSPTIKSYVPDPFKLREFVTSTPPGNERLFCTMVRHGEETSGGHYTLYLEYLGGLIPLLKGKRASKLRPDFVVFDPKIKTKTNPEASNGNISYEPQYESESDSDSDISTDGCGSPRMQRKKRPKQFRAAKVERSITFRTLDELLYNDSLPESSKLLEVTSNIWGTKFHITGTMPYLPEDLGHILYKTSLLHLQPRQMTITVTEIRSDGQLLSRDPNFSPARAIEEESDQSSFDEMLYDGGDYCHDEGILVVTETAVAGNNNKNQVVVDVLPSNSSTNQSEDNKPFLDLMGDSCGISNVLVGTERPLRTPNMKNRSLSPATESLAQNNAFNCDSNSVLKDKYVGQGAKPKVKNFPFSTGSQMTEVNVSSASEDCGNSEVSPTMNGVMRTSLHNEVEHIMKYDEENRWADRANCGIKFIDDDKDYSKTVETNHENTVICDSSQLTPTSNLTSEHQKRLYLAASEELLKDAGKDVSELLFDRRESIDSLATEDDSVDFMDSHTNLTDNDSITSSPSYSPKSHSCNLKSKDFFGDDSSGLHRDPFSISTPDFEINHSASLPASPIRRSPKGDSPTRKLREEVLKGKCKHYSPIFKRKSKYSATQIESSDEDLSSSVEEIRFSHNYKNLESFQKAQFKQKLRKVRRKSEERSSFPPMGMRQFVMHNKAPLWNENSQVYQLDFGGRVTQESAKNFQIEFRGRQVMQFGRIDSNAYTLDFQYPFTAIQAFAVALANVTQRLK
ncbi:tubby-related protein 4-like [Pecten maximus]|uniref:tubby-related protein 4-like n=1 Tax=Pecten maximus TaxID=6579 RepID=UPI0014583804|nr:tubby-related protein 4-like [Pecten maximus]